MSTVERLKAAFRLLLPVALALVVSFASPAAGMVDEFVQRAGTRFVISREDGCENFYFTGTNNYYLMLRSADEKARCEVDEVLDDAAEMGITVIRTWGFSEGPLRWRSLQPAPGEYDESTFRGMDYALNEASKRGIRLLIAFGNYWQHFGGTDQYNRWAFQAGKGTCNGEFACRDDFFTNPYTRQLYKAHIQKMLTRKNTFNGRVYRDDPTIFGWNLMNEPRCYNDLFTITRETTSGLVYNISSNNGNTLQDWIEDMAGFVKSIDPRHLLTVGEEGFFGESTPLYLYANPGAWATLEGVDFVRNHRAAGIDFASMHVYVDQWLCTERGKDREGQLEFFTDWINVHQQAAEEDLQMPVVLEEFGGKIADNKRLDLFQTSFDSQMASQERSASFGGVMFWILYHSNYFPLDKYGGGYGQYLPAPDERYQEVGDLIRGHAAKQAKMNAKHIGQDVCLFEPPLPDGNGCLSLEIGVDVGGMPWVCLPGEPANVSFCSLPQQAGSLYRNPPQQWKGTYERLDAPFNTIEVLVLGAIRNAGSGPVNLKNAWIVVPFSGGVHTKFEGEWTRVINPNDRFTLHCWAVSRYSPGAEWSDSGNLCGAGAVKLSFTEHLWPVGTKADRGLRIEFVSDVILQPGDELHGHVTDGDVMISVTDDKCASAEREECEERLDVSSMQAWVRGEDVTLNYYKVQAAMDCPEAPNPPTPPEKKPGCGHPWKACPFEGRVVPPPLSEIESAFPGANVHSRTNPAPLDGVRGAAAFAAQYYVSAEVYVSGIEGKFTRGTRRIEVVSADAREVGDDLADPGDVLVDPSDAPNPEERRTTHIASGVDAVLVLRYTIDGVLHRQVVGTNEAPDGAWTLIRGVVELPPDVGEVTIFAEVPVAGAEVGIRGASARSPSSLDASEAETYTPCEIDPKLGPDAVYVFTPDSAMTVDVKLCSSGYDQSLRIYKDGVEDTRTDSGCSRGQRVNDYKMAAGVKYTFVVDGLHGYPYGSFRGGRGIQIKRQDGGPFEGFDFAPTSQLREEFVRAKGESFYQGCKPYYYVGANTWDLMDTARYQSMWWAIDERLDEMKSQGLTVGRTWAFSLGTSEDEAGRAQRLHLAPGVYDENVFRALDYVLDAAAKRDMKLILALEDYWLSIDRYLEWSPSAGSRNDFYSEWDIRTNFKTHMRTMVNRRNSINGRLYREDPTIMAWNLINEPRCTGCAWAISSWVDEMSLYLKAIDPNHMVTIGEEGFYSSTCERVWLNPGAGSRRTGIGSSPWALQEGQDFLANHRSENIDFATVHAWPDNWISFADYSPLFSNENFDYTHGGDVWKEKLEYLGRWIGAHLDDARKLRKPVIVEEFGKAIPAEKLFAQEGPRALQGSETTAGDLKVRNAFFKKVYDLVEESARSGGPALGSNFWVLYRDSCSECYKDPYIVVKSHTSTMKVIRDHSYNMMDATQGRPAQCPADKRTWEAGQLFGRSLKPNNLTEATVSVPEGALDPDIEKPPPVTAQAGSSGCIDEAPPGASFTCKQHAKWNKCSEPWIQGYCKVSCGTCGGRNSASYRRRDIGRRVELKDEPVVNDAKPAAPANATTSSENKQAESAAAANETTREVEPKVVLEVSAEPANKTTGGVKREEEESGASVRSAASGNSTTRGVVREKVPEAPAKPTISVNEIVKPSNESAAGSVASGCFDVQPPNSVLPCKELAELDRCSAPTVRYYCKRSCGRCTKGGNEEDDSSKECTRPNGCEVEEQRG